MKKKHVVLTTMTIILIDQLIKYVIISTMDIGEIKNLFGQVVKLHYVINTGGAFSIGHNKLSIIIVLNIILIGIIIYILAKNLNKLDRVTIIPIIMILGGGISNLIDRLSRKSVIDYIDINYLFKYPVFNLADIFIVIGVISLIILLLFRKPKEQEN